MNFKSIEKFVEGKNVLLVFLLILVVIVIIDCNTKMFSNMLNTIEGQNGANNGVASVGGTCGRDYTAPAQMNPTNAAQSNCNAASAGVNSKNNSNNNNNNNGGAKSGPSGFM
jgi:hypothetical protein